MRTPKRRASLRSAPPYVDLSRVASTVGQTDSEMLFQRIPIFQAA